MKKTEYITFRTDAKTKELLTEYAAGKKWSISLLVEDIVQEWVENKISPIVTETSPSEGISVGVEF